MTTLLKSKQQIAENGGDCNGRRIYCSNPRFYNFVVYYKLCSMYEWIYNKAQNPDDYIEINRKQREKDIAQVKAQDKYDNDWGYIR